ncbi:unnamed protein product, partial [Effrenium voratum]
EMAAILLPAMLGGNSLGIVVSKVFPPTLLVVLSLVLLLLTSAKTTLKGLAAYRQSAVKGASSLGNLQQPLDLRDNISVASDSMLHNACPRRRGQQSLHSTSTQSLQDTQMRIPWKAICFMVGFNFLFCADYLIMSKDVGVETC